MADRAPRVPTAAALDLLLSLLEAPEPVLSGFAAQQGKQAVVELSAHGVLLPAGIEPVAVVETDDGEVPVPVAWCPERGAYGYYTAATGWVTVKDESIRRHRLDIPALLGCLTGSLRRLSGGAPRELIEALAWDLGEVALPGRSARVSVWFSRRLFDGTTWRAVRQRARAQPARSGRILLTSTPEDRLADDAMQDVSIMALDDLLAARSTLALDPGLLVARLDRLPAQADDGLPVITGDGREVRFRGGIYRFPKGDQQRRIIVYLHAKALAGIFAVSTAELVAQLDLPEATRLRDTFKRHPAWDKLVYERDGMCGFCGLGPVSPQ